MLFELTDLCGRYHMKIDGILHVGAHLAEEADEYHKLGIDRVVWVEANDDNMSRIYDKVHPLGHTVVQALITDTIGHEVTFNITNADSMSSSIYEFGIHPTFSPEIVFVERRPLQTSTIDHLLATLPDECEGINMINLDIQGAELLALHGAEKFLDQIDYIYTEVNSKEVYIGCAKVWELDEYLAEFGFERVETNWVGEQGWGDALYIRSKQ